MAFRYKKKGEGDLIIAENYILLSAFVGGCID
jgi:hypothetical protein